MTGARTVVSDASTGSGPNFQVATGLGLECGGNFLVGDQSARILRVDPANGDRTILSDSSSSGISLSYPRGVDVVLQPVVPVPSMSPKGLLVLAGLLLVAATVTVRSIIKRAEETSH
jgi:hypothetical protein